MTNLVTGATGFIGSHLVERLLAAGETVIALVRDKEKARSLKEKGAELYSYDFQTGDPACLKEASQGASRVFHLAAIASDWGPWSEFVQVNVDGVQQMLEAAVAAKVKRFIHLSTTDVYGHPDYGADESAPYRYRNLPYVDTKIDGEKLVRSYYQKYKLPVTIIRPVNVYGPGSMTFVMEIIGLLRERGMVFVGKEKPAGLCYVQNLVDLILLAAEKKEAIGQIYNGSDGSDFSWRDYVNGLADILNLPRPKVILPFKPAYFIGWLLEKLSLLLRASSRPTLTRLAVLLLGTNQGFPIDKAREELGYEPRICLREGLEKIKTWRGEEADLLP